MSKERDAAIYREGVMDALARFAVYSNGEQRVGCGIYTLEEAIRKTREWFPSPDFDEDGNPVRFDFLQLIDDVGRGNRGLG